ncbi:DUF3800 domain-containing protein [Stenotrophomonas acidaminiphila]|uniref:DUF3800 domain-containing protein n=1 Tax=Stenotrophomonas acidaminiphila TaxID=128780 RepID=UPI001FAEF66B|nr:DUF3800 domain-containing protein [Stenotrophomonas acidaminiphila]
MFIYIDESGSFVLSPTVGSWNVVAAYVTPEADRRRAELALRELKLASNRAHTDEIKLRDIKEQQLKVFLKRLRNLDSILFISGIDLGQQKFSEIIEHQAIQAAKIRANKPRMIYEEGRTSIESLASRIEQLSPQLYTQFVAQIDLLDQVYRATTLYYSQRIPATIGSFRWRIDEKNSARPLFEETIRHMAPALIQSKSLEEPGIFVDGFDYSHYERAFGYRQDEIPKYLQEETGIEIKSASNLGKILSDFSFVRSHDLPGVQIADILASAYRRALRGEFQDNVGISHLLGALTVQRANPEPSIHLITLSEEMPASGVALEVAQTAKKAAKPMLR